MKTKYGSSRLAAFYDRKEGRGNAGPIAKTTPAAKPRPAAPAPIAKAPPESVKARADAVLASPVCKGREKQARELLMASCDRDAVHKTSAAIIAELGRRCSDTELARRIEAHKAAQAQSGMSACRRQGKQSCRCHARPLSGAWRALRGKAMDSKILATVARAFDALDFTAENMAIAETEAELARLEASATEAEARCTEIAGILANWKGPDASAIANALLTGTDPTQAAKAGPSEEGLKAERDALRLAIGDLGSRAEAGRERIEAHREAALQRLGLPVVEAQAANATRARPLFLAS